MQAAIRKARAGDQPAVRALLRGERVNPFGLDWRNFLVAEAEGAVVGSVQLRPAGPGAVELGSLAVRADLRRAGLGARLAAAAVAEAGPRRVLAVVPAANAGFYARWGFREIAPGDAPWPVRLRWRLGRAGSLVALARGHRPQRLAVLDRPAGAPAG